MCPEMKPKLLVHVGLHKTGSSVLQKFYFTEENGYLQHCEGRRIFRFFVDKFCTDTLTAYEINILSDFMKLSATKNLCAVISHERLSGYPLYGGYDRLSIYHRIQTLMEHFDVKILCVVREQNDWILSMWQQLIVDGASLSLDNFISSNIDEGYRLPHARLEYLDYFLELKTLTEIFGKSNVLMVPYESLFQEFTNFHNNLTQFCGITPQSPTLTLPRVNQRRKFSTVYALRLINRLWFIPKKLKSFLRTCSLALPEAPFQKSIKKYLISKIQISVGDKFAESNQSLEKELGINLVKHGYVVNRQQK